MNESNRIDPTPVRVSTNVSVDRQTPKSDFGDRLQTGMQATASALGSGAAIVSPLIPGAGIVSAAVSSVGNATGSSTSTLSHQYGTVATASPMVTTVGTGTGVTPGVTPTTGGALPGYGTPDITQTPLASGPDMIANMASEQTKMLQLQYSMQQESQMYQTVSNVLKTRNDTAKNAIGNIR